MEVMNRLNQLNSLSENNENIVEMKPIGRLLLLEDTPFSIYTGERKDNLINHIREYGLLNPIIVHKENVDDRIIFRVICGANRLDACKTLEYKEVPCIIKENLTQDELNSIMIGDNLFRREIKDMLPSQLAKALKLLNDSENRQGKRTDLMDETSRNNFGMLEKDYSLSRRSIQLYIRLTCLTDGLLKLVDDNKLNFVVAVTLSFLKQQEMIELYEYITKNNYKITPKVAEELKKLSQSAEDTIEVKSILEGLNKPEEKQIKVVKLTSRELNSIIPKEDLSRSKEIVLLALKRFYNIA